MHAAAHPNSRRLTVEIDGAPAAAVVRAAEYVRMSTDHQQYSIDNQTVAIRQYADEQGYQVVRTYSDAARSGLRIDNRQALQRLISDVQNGSADFQAVL